MANIIPREYIEKRILLIRSQKVVLGVHLAELYGVEPRALNQAVKRNRSRFPKDFMFRLSAKEAAAVVSQNVIPHRKYFGGALPMVFTEHGVAMLSSVLNSERAIQVNIAIVRVFVRFRRITASHRQLSSRLGELEQRFAKHDIEIQTLFDAIRQLMVPPEKSRREIGFRVGEPKAENKVRRKSSH
jgi:hypothetical protein